MRVRGARARGDHGGWARRRKIVTGRKLALLAATIAAVEGASLSIRAQSTHGIPPALYQDLTWRCIGPFDGGPVASVAGVAGEAGVYEITTPSGGVWKTVDGGATWTSIARSSVAAAAGDPHRWADPANPRRVARTEPQGIGVSLDGGATWAPFHAMPIAEVTRLPSHERATEPGSARRAIAGKPVNVSIVDPVRSSLIFAGTNDAVHVSFDGGGTWASLQLNMPPVAINDLDVRGQDLVAATQGRSVWTIADISPLRQLSPASASAPAILFRPSDAVITTDAASDDAFPGGALDYYLAAAAKAVKLEVLDATGRAVHTASSTAPDSTDRWLAVTRPLPVSAGQHRVVWNLRLDPPPSPQHRFARLAPALFATVPPDPDGPRVLAGAYQVRLTAGGHVYSQPLAIRSARPPDAADAARQQFALAMREYDAMQIAHRGFLQLKRAREQLKPLLTSSDPDVAAAATGLDARLAVLDGSDWTGLVIPDADDEVGEVDEKEGKHPDFVPPKPVSLSKDYDDPTSVLGRNFANVDHAPAFAILATKLGEMLTRLSRESAAPDALAAGNYATACQQLAGVLDAWREINAQDLPSMNAELSKRGVPRLPVAPNVPAIVCTPGGR